MKIYKPLETIKRKRTKSKYNKKGNAIMKQENKSKFKHNKTNHTKHLRESKDETNEDDNLKNTPAFMKEIVTDAQVTKPVQTLNVFNKKRKAIFLTLYPEDFTVKFTRKRLNNKVTKKKRKKNTIWEDNVTDIEVTTKGFDLEENKKVEKNNSNITETPESIENLQDKSEITKLK